MDFQDYRIRFQNLFKAKPSNFATFSDVNNKELRCKEQEVSRKNTRSNALLERRNIKKMEQVKNPAKEELSKNARKPDRLETLRQWKIQKEMKLKADRAQKKPIFKACVAANTGFPAFNSKYTDLNQKHIFHRVTRSQKAVASPPLPLPVRRKTNKALTENDPKPSNRCKFATPHLKSKHLKFTAQNNKENALQPTAIFRNKLVRQNAVNDSTVSSKKGTPKRRQSRRKSKRKSVLKINSTSLDEQNIDIVTEEVDKLSASSSGMSTQYAISDNPGDSTCDEVFESPSAIVRTPEHNKGLAAYVSPFVTTSRGKGSVKKENLERSIRGLPSFSEHNTPDKLANSKVQATGAAYFHILLDKEIARLLNVCEIWNNYKEAGDVPDDAQDMIDVAVGQANLLINKKFQQFRGLIHSCQNGDGDQKVTCEDLQGFWDMVYMQVVNISTRFNRLQEMKNNNWEEIKSEEIKTKVVKKRELKKRTQSAPSSNIRAAIQAARQKTLQSKCQSSEAAVATNNTESVFNGGFFVVRSPHKNTPKTKTPKKGRRSLLVSVLSTEAKKTSNHNDPKSPGVSMMKASWTAKSFENLQSVDDECTVPTPGKSILKKSKYQKTLHDSSKAVLFENHNNDCENDPAAMNIPDLITFDSPVQKENTPRRKSKRNKMKI